MIFKREKKKPLLYQRYKQEKERPSGEVGTGGRKGKRKEKGTRAQPLPARPASTIFVGSLKKGCGCSHLSLLLQQHLKENKRRAAVIGLGDYSPAAFHREFENGNDSIILDCGCIHRMNSGMALEMQRADIRILMCLYDEEYLTELADHMETIRPEQWKFVFNYVSKGNWKEVDDLMEEYQHRCLPLMSQGETQKKENKKTLRWILGTAE